MAIFKVSPGDMHEFEETYVVLPSASIALCESVEALAILAYLLDKPDDWIIRDVEVIARFKNLGRHRFKRAIRELKQKRLLRCYRIRDEDGVFAGAQRDLFAHPDMCPTISTEIDPMVPAISTDFDPMGGKTGLDGLPTISTEIDQMAENTGSSSISTDFHPMDIPPDGKSTHLHITDSLHITDCTQGTADADAVVFESSGLKVSRSKSETIPGEQEQTSIASKEISRRDFDDICIEVMGGTLPRMWGYLSKNDFIAKSGAVIDCADALRQELTEIRTRGTGS